MLSKSPDMVSKVLQYTTIAVNTLHDVTATTQIPFLQIIPMVQNAKLQKARCFKMMDQIHHLLCTLIRLCIHSDSDIRSPNTLSDIAAFAMTLQKFQSCLKAQQDLGTIKRLFKQNEITSQLDICEGELRTATETFTIKYSDGVTSALVKMNLDTERRHQELLELISSESDSFDNASSMGRSSLNFSSDSFSLLPASPPIFHGRESVLETLANTLLNNPVPIAILGPGGIGKTTVAMAALHHPSVKEKYASRHFISCESASNRDDLLLNIGSNLGLEPSKQLSKAILSYFQESGPSLVILDNFETPWEAPESRSQVEEFLSLMSDIPTLALVVTMRGAERPGKVKWNRPFLPPLEPLSPSASRQIFLDIADGPTTEEEFALDELLELSGRLPLAVSLMASIVSFEGYSGTLLRWQNENTALLSDGHTKRSNLEKSIILSLGSPRMSASPHAKDLLSLLSLLPDGIRAEDIMASKVPIPDIRRWQSLLVGTSLAYLDRLGRLRALSPIREYIRRAHPASAALADPLCRYFQALIEMWGEKRELPANNLAPVVVASMGNINELLRYGLTSGAEKSTQIEIGYSIIALDSFSAAMLKGNIALFHLLPQIIEDTGDAGLRWKYTGRCISNPVLTKRIMNAEAVIEEGVQYFQTGLYPKSQAVRFYRAAALYYTHRSVHRAEELAQLALSLALESRDSELQLLSMHTEVIVACYRDDPHRVIQIAHKAWKIARFTTTYWEYRCTEWEAWGCCHSGNLVRALELCAHGEELLISDGQEDSDRFLQCLDIRADVYLAKTDYNEARRIYKRIAEMTAPTRSPWFHAYSLTILAHIDIITEGEVAGILENLDAAAAVYTAHDRKSAFHSAVATELQLYRGDVKGARASFMACLASKKASRTDMYICLAALGDPRHGVYRAHEGFRWAVVYCAFARKTKDMGETLNALRCIGDIYVAFGDDETALGLFQVALEAGTRMDVHRLRAECMVGIGDIMTRRGDLVQAREMWAGAHPLFLRSSQGKDAASVDKRLKNLQLQT
ncbi:NB-ARC domain-containing protein [Mycena sanguinolenta]|uniref:NB-ARC domain-containing protein n=1 Tax=Mycena sanguinolenta TaxID=230812 RepID=A0A8H7CNZ0_9AGAR|nr:NB-ARC domain-containing protein [Mycena sanguinolenta]